MHGETHSPTDSIKFGDFRALQTTVTWHPHASASYALLQAITKISQWRELVDYYNFFNEMHPLAKVIPRTCLQT